MTPIKVNRSHVAKTLCDAWIYWKLASDAVWSSCPTLLLFGLPAQALLFAWSCHLLVSYLLESQCLTFLFHPQYSFPLKIKVSSLLRRIIIASCTFFFFFPVWMFSSASVAAEIGSWLQWIIALFKQPLMFAHYFSNWLYERCSANRT